jgi:hypothetical protein
MATHLRVYPAAVPEEDPEPQAPTVHVRVGDLLPLLAMAARHNYLWLQDFFDDEVAITPDLYEVIRAFRCHKPSA